MILKVEPEYSFCCDESMPVSSFGDEDENKHALFGPLSGFVADRHLHMNLSLE